MKKQEISQKNKFDFSIELFPAKTDQSFEKLKKVIDELKDLSPNFFSVTYGAGGSTKDSTYKLVNYIKQNTNIDVAAHLTCVGSSRQEVNNIAKSYLDIGVTKIVALRGDMPKGAGSYKPHPDGYNYANDLVEGLLNISNNFDISVASYPEKHPESDSSADDINYLKKKLDAGAKNTITQYCMETKTIIEFINFCKESGITKEIVPGILLMNGFNQFVSFSKMCGSSVPDWMYDLFDSENESLEESDMISSFLAIEQCKSLINNGVRNFHFYSLNRSNQLIPIIKLLQNYNNL